MFGYVRQCVFAWSVSVGVWTGLFKLQVCKTEKKSACLANNSQVQQQKEKPKKMYQKYKQKYKKYKQTQWTLSEHTKVQEKDKEKVSKIT